MSNRISAMNFNYIKVNDLQYLSHYIIGIYYCTSLLVVKTSTSDNRIKTYYKIIDNPGVVVKEEIEDVMICGWKFESLKHDIENFQI